MSTTQAVDLRAGGECSLLDRLLGLAAEVRAGEGLTALALAFNGFLILGAYYVIRPLRDMLSGLAVLLLVQVSAFGVRAYAGVNLALVVVWVLIALGLFKEHRRLSAPPT